MQGLALRCLAAAAGEESWADAFEAIAEATGSTWVAHPRIVEGDGEEETRFSFDGARFDESMWAPWQDYYWSVEPWRPFLPEAIPGTVRHGAEVLALSDLEKTEYYADFFQKLDGYDTVILVLENDPAHGIAALTLNRSRSEPPWKPDELDALRPLVAPLRSATRMARDLEFARGRAEDFEAVLAEVSSPCFWLAGDGRLIGASETGRELLDSGDGLMYRNGRLRVDSPEGDAELSRLIARCASLPAHGDTAQIVQIQRRARAEPLLLTARPLVASSSSNLDPRVRVLVCVRDPAAMRRGLRETGRRVWNLTAREAHAAELLALGHSTSEIADTLEIQVNTVNAHLKRVYAKTSVKRQSELVSRLLRADASGAFRAPR